MNQEISDEAIGELLASRAGDRAACRTIAAACSGVNTAAESVAYGIRAIRTRLDAIERATAPGRRQQLGELQRLPAELNRALAAREHWYQVLWLLLDDDERQALEAGDAA